jgi:23S rRNA G2445 N2-methylase RlmL
MDDTLIKITFVHGLQELVLKEIAEHPELRTNLHIVERDIDCVYFGYEKFTRTELLKLRTVSNIYIVKKGLKLHPQHIFHHKSILGDLIGLVIHMSAGGDGKIGAKSGAKFKTFKLRCAGSDSPEAISIQKYISETFKLTPAEEADLDIYIHKPGEMWEIGVRITERRLSLREYKTEHIKGGMNPTIAYAVNTLANISSYLNNARTDTPTSLSYLNICSGSGTLLTEAGLALGKDIAQAKLLGFDIDKKANSQAIRNITNAGLIKSIQIKTADVLENPNFGMFDVITSDLPFGMQIGKGTDLAKLYSCFVKYAAEKLNAHGTLVVYTTEADIFEKALKDSKFAVEKSVTLRITTAVNSYIHPKVFVCKFR